MATSPAFFGSLHSQFDDEEEPQVMTPGAPYAGAPAQPRPGTRPMQPAAAAPSPSLSLAPANTNRPPRPTPPAADTAGTRPAWYQPFAGSGGTAFWDPSTGYGTNQDQYNTRTFLAGHNIAVGKSAFENQSANNPNVQRMSWKDLAAAAGITDFQGAKRDPRFEALKSAFYGHVNDAEGNLAERQQYADALRQSLGERFGEVQQPGSGPGSGGPGGQLGFEAELEQLLRSAMRGDDGPFSDEVRNNMRASAKEDAAGQLAATNKMANLSAVRSGNLYSGSTGETLAENARASDAALNRGFRDIDVQGAQANFDAKLKSRDQALSLLQQRKEEAMANARNAIDRERIKNDYDVAIQGIAVQREQIAAQKEAADKASRAEMASGNAWRQHELEKMNLQRQWDVEDYANRELPFMMGEYGG